MNDFIGAAYGRVAEDFLEHVVKRRSSRFVTTSYEIFTNCLDSHLWFDDESLNRWYEVWRRG